MRNNIDPARINKAVAPVIVLAAASAVLTACTSAETGDAPDNSHVTHSETAPRASKTTAPAIASNNLAANYDLAADQVIGFEPISLTSPVAVDVRITNPSVRQLTLNELNLDTADSVVTAVDGSVPLDEDALKPLGFITDPKIKQRAQEAIGFKIYDDVAQDLSNGVYEPADITAHETSMGSFMSKKSFAKAKTTLQKMAKLAKKDQQLVDSGKDDTETYDKLSDLGNKVFEDANDVADKISDDMFKAYDEITRKSPATQKMEKQGNADYQKYLHHCDNLGSLAQQKCFADEAISDAQSQTENLFEIWAPKVKDPTQKLRLEKAAATAAVDYIKDGYSDLADPYSKYVKNPGDIDRIDKALAAKAGSYYDEGYPALGDALVDKIHDPVDQAAAKTHKR